MAPSQGRMNSTFTRLPRHGFTDPPAARRLLDALELAGVRGDSVLLDGLGATVDPDLALRGLVRLIEALPEIPEGGDDKEGADSRQALLDTLVTTKPLRDRLLGVLGASEALGDHLARHPQAWHALQTYEPADLHPATPEFEQALAEGVWGEAGAGMPRPDALRVAYRKALLAIAARDVCGSTDITQVAAELADLATATLRAALEIAAQEEPEDAAACRLAVIGMGTCGGRELSYVSDVDVIFVAEAVDGVEEGKAVRAATRLATRLMRICSDVTVEGTIWPVDADLRPEGRDGPLVRTLSSHAAYYRRWARTWEFQALLKARPVAGAPGLGERFIELIDPLRYPPGGLEEDAVREIRRLKARMESERLPRGADPTTHTKLGRGGLSDVAWTVQLLQMRHGRAEPGLRTTRTRRALAAAHAAGLIGRDDARTLDEAWVLAGRVRNAVMLIRGRRGDSFPGDALELAAVARYLGYGPGRAGEMLDDYRRTTRRARVVMERLFYGYER